jgi:hypothetical protein
MGACVAANRPNFPGTASYAGRAAEFAGLGRHLLPGPARQLSLKSLFFML